MKAGQGNKKEYWFEKYHALDAGDKNPENQWHKVAAANEVIKRNMLEQLVSAGIPEVSARRLLKINSHKEKRSER